MKTYYIYHIKGVKIGCSTQPIIRVKKQGYTDFEILESHIDIDIADIREKELQRKYGYKVDTATYKQSREWACKGSSNGGKKVHELYPNLAKEIGSKNGKLNGINSRYKLQKKVIQYDLNGNFIKEWPGVNLIQRETNICVSKCVRGLKKTAGGYIWKFKPISPH
jgi:hypothetical protein